ncbi:hypothetical protein ACFPRA_17100 [Sporosarcina soli]|uniref:Uncharacterized protein n=1 Tax=Sporosarcina soli TaxID=334736 RepID=A0ABW0TM91_9BACL
MGLFMNREDHPEVYTNDLGSLEPNNQRISTIDPFTEWVAEQKEANLSLQRQLHDLQSLLKEQDTRQSTQFQTIHNRLHGLHEREVRQQQFENEVIESFVQLHAEHHSFQRKLAEERQFNRTVAKQVDQISQSTNGIAERLEEVVVANDVITKDVNEQLVAQKRLSEQLIKQEDAHDVLLERIDKQEGMTEKLFGQMDHLRSILYERSTMLAEKIEGSYLTTFHFISKLLTRHEQPTARFMVNQKQDKKE